MENILIFLSLIIATTASPLLISNATTGGIRNYTNYRLPENIKPSKYEINLHIPNAALTGESTNFTGNVTITLNLIAPTDTIFIHSAVNFSPDNVTLFDPFNKAYSAANIKFNDSTQIATIVLNETLIVNTSHYILNINFEGNLDTLYLTGLYRSEYNIFDSTSNVTSKEYLATTQFQPTSARQVFPCFDEPQYKAVFVLKIRHPSAFTAVSNTPGTTNNDKDAADISVTTFEPTPIMPTYTLAFTVSKFNCTTTEPSPGTDVDVIQHKVCSRPALWNKTSLALDHGIQIINALGTWTNFSYSSMGIRKIDQFAVPDFVSGAMENWGLVIYKEHLLVYDELHTSNSLKQQIISVIAHEFSHMWFGNLITTQWWDTIFLNEGFATYFQYFTFNLIGLESYEMNKHFMIDVQKFALSTDGYKSSKALTAEVWTPSQSVRNFNSIAYSKGSSILRMVENVVGPENFQSSVRQYITTNSFNSTTSDILWSNFNLSSQPNINFTFTEFIENWTNRGGYPMINATVNGTDIILSQEHFLYNGNDNSSTQWYVPIFYKKLKESTSSVVWLLPNSSVTIENGSAGNSWVVINQGASGYFRVNYDNILSQRIISTLETNHLLLSDIDRAQIIDDYFNLARAGYIKYSEALKILNYLVNETSYYPWKAAINGFKFLSVRVGEESELGRSINARIIQLIQNVSTGLSEINWTEVDHVTSLKFELIWTAACGAGQEICISESSRLFQDFKINGTSINPNIRKAVYCNALRNSTNATDWQYLWDRLQTFDDLHEMVYIRESLGCTKSKTQLMFLLDQSLNSTLGIKNKDKKILWNSVYSNSPVGLQVAFEHFTSNYTNLHQNYSRAGISLSDITSYFSSGAEIRQLEEFMKQKNSTEGEQALLDAKKIFAWQQRVEGDLRTTFGLPQLNPEQPDTEQPDTEQPDNGKPDPTQPDPSQPDPSQPDPEKPDPTQPDPVQPDPEKPDPTQPNPTQPDPVQPDPEKPDPTQPDPEQPDPEKPDPEQPDQEKPDPEQPDQEKPDAEQPDSVQPDTDEPDSDNSATSMTVSLLLILTFLFMIYP